MKWLIELLGPLGLTLSSFLVTWLVFFLTTWYGHYEGIYDGEFDATFDEKSDRPFYEECLFRLSFFLGGVTLLIYLL